MTTRRGFFGLISGAFASTFVPFTKVEGIQEPKEENKYSWYNLGKLDFHKCRISFYGRKQLPDGSYTKNEYWWCSPIVEVEKTENKIYLTTKPVKIQHNKWRIEGYRLVDSNGCWVKPLKIMEEIEVCPGDEIIVTYVMTGE